MAERDRSSAERGDAVRTAPPIELSGARNIHVVGVGGAGMSAIALVLAQMGHTVSGSDLRASRLIERLRLAGVTCAVGHDAANVAVDADAVVISSAVGEDNPEVRAARERGIDVLRRAEILAAIAAMRRAIAVAGTHGKTTTSSMLTLVLRAAGMHPCFVIGGELNEVGTNAAWDDGDWLVIEADESDGTFLELPCEGGIVTSVEPDHLEHYGTFDALVAAFEAFVDRCSAPLAICIDEPHAAALAARRADTIGYGFSDGARVRVIGYEPLDVGCSFTVEIDGAIQPTFELSIPGRHNVRNACAAIAIAAAVGAPLDAAARALSGFAGVARRFQFRGRRNGVTFVDDYAHLPAEVAATIDAARDGPYERVIVVFQPHRYSRTESLGAEFAHAFDGADHVIVTDVYPAGETLRPGVSGRLVLDSVAATAPGFGLDYAPAREDLLDVPDRLARPGDLVLTLGAGDLTSLPDEWLREAS